MHQLHQNHSFETSFLCKNRESHVCSVHTKELMRLKTTLEAKMCTLKLCVMYVHKTFTCIPWMKQHRVADRHVVGKYSTQNSVRSICLKCSFALLLLRYTYTCETFPEFWQAQYCLIPAALFSCVESLSMTRTVTSVQSVFDHINPIVASWGEPLYHVSSAKQGQLSYFNQNLVACIFMWGIL